MFRILLYGLIFMMIIRMIKSAFRPKPEPPKESSIKNESEKKKRVSKDVGEYVDYEEVK